MNLDTVVDFALAYAGAGYRVIPVRGKIPLVEHGAHDATTDEATLRSWWDKWPDANIGLTLEGLVVVDIDPRNGGDADALPHPLPETCYAKTGGGGFHYLYRAKNGTKYPGTLGAGIDIKAGAGAYIVVEPSVHASGEKYNWLDESEPWTTAPTEAPAWLAVKPEAPRADREHGAQAGDWLDSIARGESLHDSLRDLAAHYAALGIGFAEICKLLELALHASQAPRDERWSERLDGIPKLVNSAIEKFRSPSAADNALLHVLALPDFLSHTFKPRASLIGPITTQALGMVHGYRGGGKTWYALAVALAAAAGGSAFGWKALRPIRTFYGDGEMAGADLQNRIRLLSAAHETTWDGATLRILTPDLQDGSLPDLATHAGQIRIEAAIGDSELIFLDNLSAWVRGTGEENAAESWLPMLDWLLRMRSQGRSVVVLHHSGKTGLQRGTSKREDVLDFVIALRRPNDYQPQEGCRFELHFEKSRGLHGAAVAPFEAHLVTDDHGSLTWTTRTIELATMDRVVSLSRDGLSQKDIASELGINKSTVFRTMKKAEETGLLPDENRATKRATRGG